MPVTLSYPGVYVQEIPSGVRTITGVPTSIAAFVGRAAKGPTDTAATITSYADYERTFGGLAPFSAMSFAVRDFFLNGGATAVVVRLYEPEADADPENPPVPVAAKTAIPVTIRGADTADAADDVALNLEAATPGTWGKGLRVTIDANVPAGLAASMGLLATENLFNLAVTDVNSGAAELHPNLTLRAGHPANVKVVLAARSQLLRVAGTPPTGLVVPPQDGDGNALPIKDVVSAAEDALEAARRAIPYDEADVATAKSNLDAAKDALTGNDGSDLGIATFFPANGLANKQGLYALEGADLFNILVTPPLADAAAQRQLVSLAASYCETRRAFYIVDPPAAWNGVAPGAVVASVNGAADEIGTRSKNAAVYWPRIMAPNNFKGGLIEAMSPSGVVAGIFARTDAERGVWKAPAGLDATLNGVVDLEYRMTDGENGLLNPLGVNALRIKQPAGRVVYGARTLQGDDRLAAEYKYIPVRRLALFIEESAYRGLQWAVFEPNDEPLWASIRLNLGAFMHNLFRQGAFQGKTPTDAYFVKCDAETTTQNDVDLGIVNVVLGFAPLKPAEFVVIGLKQIAGQVEV